MSRMRVPVAVTRADRLILTVLAALAALAVGLVWLTDGIVDPPRPRVSASAVPTIGLAVAWGGGGARVLRAAGPARSAGLRPGDRIVAVGDLETPGPAAIREAVRACRDGDTLRIEARRSVPGGETTAILADVIVAVRPPSPGDVGLPYEDVSFRNADGLNLRGWYVPPPRGGLGRAPAIAWGHGNAADRRQWLFAAAAVHEAGVAQLLFDFTGRGDSDGDVISLGAHEAGDLRSALDMLAARPEIDPLRLATGGKSMGAAAAILEAAGDARVRALVLDSPYADLMGVVDHAFASRHLPAFPLAPVLMKIAGWRASYDPWAVRPVDAIGKIRAPILLFHGTADTIVPFADARRLAAAARGPVTLVSLPGLGHNDPRPDGTAERIASFLRSTLAR